MGNGSIGSRLLLHSPNCRPPNLPMYLLANLPIRLSAYQLMQRGKEPVNFLNGVVMHQADAQHATAGLDAQPLAQVKGIIVSVPCEYPALAEVACQFARSVSDNTNRHGRHAFGATSGIFDSIKCKAGNRQESADEPLRQAAFVGANHIVGGEQGGTARGDRGRRAPAEFGEVIDGSENPCLAFVVLGAGFPPVGILLPRRADLVRP